MYITNNHESSALNLFQFLLDNGCSITLDEDAQDALGDRDMGGWGNGAKARAYVDAIKAVDGYASIRYEGNGYRGWVQFAIGWGNKPWEEVPNFSAGREGIDELGLADIWHEDYQSRIGDKLIEELYNRVMSA